MIRARFHDLDGQSAYQVLGVAEDAGPDEINKGYRRRMRALHPDSLISAGNADVAGSAGEQAQSVTTAHRWLTRQRADYDVFVAGRRRADPQWGKDVAAPAAPSAQSSRPGPVTGSFRTVHPEQLGERAQWAERQRREQWQTSANPQRSAWRKAPDPVRTSAATRPEHRRSAWEAQPSPERQMWNVSREEVARRRQERRQAEEERRGASWEKGSAGAKTAKSGDPVGHLPVGDDAGPAGDGATGVLRKPGGGARFVAGAGRKRKTRLPRRIRLPRLGLPRLPRLGLPAAPRVGLPVLPRVGLSRLGVRLLPRRRVRSGVNLESLVLAVLIVVLGLMVAARFPN